MPVYLFRCKKCDSRYEVEKHASPPVCCNVTTSRIYTVPSISFRGGGFYSNDYK